MSDLSNLVDMGFTKEKAELALKKSGNLTSAIDWLDKNADKSVSDLQAEDAAADAATDKENDNPALEAG
jgi:uncharacterized UBP type Zn finger protein